MKKYLLTYLAIMLVTLPSNAQHWSVGVTAGGDINTYSIDTEYQYDWRYKDVGGITLGIMGQYQMNDWFALRADFNYTQKNYRQHRTGKVSMEDYTHHNSYLQLPLMASFSFGTERIRGFLNLGVYGAYWTGGNISGTTTDVTFGDILDESDLESAVSFDMPYVFNSTRDNRLELGTVGGIGAEYRFNDHWAIQAELRMYYSLSSTTKDYMRIKNPRYNTTIACQLGCAYTF